VPRWRRVDLAAAVAKRLGVTLAERTVGALLRRRGFRRLPVRPRHPKADAAAQEAYKDATALVAAAIPQAARDKPIESCCQDAARVGQQG